MRPPPPQLWKGLGAPLALFVLLLPFAVLRASVRLLPPPDHTTPMTRTGGIDRRATWEVLHACRFRADVACEDRGAVDLGHHPDAIDGGRFTALLFFCRRPSRWVCNRVSLKHDSCWTVAATAGSHGLMTMGVETPTPSHRRRRASETLCEEMTVFDISGPAEWIKCLYCEFDNCAHGADWVSFKPHASKLIS